MRPATPFPPKALQELEALLPQARHVGERRKIESCLLRARHQWPAEKIAQEVGLSVGRVHHIHAAYLKEGKAALVGRGDWGGPKRNAMTPQQERDFLKTFEARAIKGEIAVVQTIKDAFEHKTKREVSRATIYNLLHRNGWRKVKPEPGNTPKGLSAHPVVTSRATRYVWIPGANPAAGR